MKIRLPLLSLCMLAIVLFDGLDRTRSQTNQLAATGGLSTAERDLLGEINSARAHPGEYAGYLEKLRPLFDGKVYSPSGQEAYATQEGWSAVEEAMKFLRTAKPQGPLNMSSGLCLAAATHVKDRERVLTWLIDDGFASRGHRMRIMSENYRVAGVSCGPHPQFGAMCVLTLAGGFIEFQPAKPEASTSANTNTSTNTNTKSNNPKNTNSKKPRKWRSH